MSAESATPVPAIYPARLQVDYSARYDRVKTLFRLVLIIPIAIVYGVLTAGATQTVYDESGEHTALVDALRGDYPFLHFLDSPPLNPATIPTPPFIAVASRIWSTRSPLPSGSFLRKI